MLIGFNYPLTPKGKSDLVAPSRYYWQTSSTSNFGRPPQRWLYCRPGSIPTLPQMVTAMLSSTIGSSAGITKNTLIPPAISIASSSFSWMPYTRVSRSPTVPISLWTTMLHSLGGPGRRAIQRLEGVPDQVLRRDRKGRPRPCTGIEVCWVPHGRGNGSPRGTGHPERAGNRPVALAERPISSISALSAPRWADKQNQPVLHGARRERPARLEDRTSVDRSRVPSAARLQRRRISESAPLRSGTGIRASMSYVVDDSRH